MSNKHLLDPEARIRSGMKRRVDAAESKHLENQDIKWVLLAKRCLEPRQQVYRLPLRLSAEL